MQMRGGIVSYSELLSAQLQRLIPNSSKETIDFFTRIIIAASQKEPVDGLLNAPEVLILADLLQQLAGQSININDTIISFGANSQIGEVFFRDVAGRDINYTINLSTYNADGINSSRTVRAAEIFMRLGDHKEAIDLYTKALKDNPESKIFFRRAKANLFLGEGEKKAAAQWLQGKSLQDRLAKYTDDDYKKQLEFFTAFGTRRANYRDQALRDIQYAVKLNDDPSFEKELRFERLLILSETNTRVQNKEWEEDLKFLYNNCTETEKAQILFLEVYRTYGNMEISAENALQVLNKINEAISLGYSTAKAFIVRAEAHLAMHNYGLTLSDVNLAISLSLNDTDLIEACALKGYVLQLTRQYHEFYKFYNELREKNPRALDNYWSTIYEIEEEIIVRVLLQLKFFLYDTDIAQIKNLASFLKNQYENVKERYPELRETFAMLIDLTD